jgi:hypothetical protein
MIRKSGHPVFPRDKRGTRLRGDHAQTKELERDDENRYPAIEAARSVFGRSGERSAPARRKKNSGELPAVPPGIEGLKVHRRFNAGNKKNRESF